MKKIFIILVILAAIPALVITGCSKQIPPVKGTGEITVRLLTDASGVDDKSFNASSWRGILEFYGDTWASQAKRGQAYDVVAAEKDDMFVPVLMQASDEGYDLIAATGFGWAGALDQVAPLYPNQKYLMVDVDWLSSPNIMQATYAEHEGSFLVGVAAALKSIEDGIANPRFGFIGGIPDVVITKFEVGYVQGIHSIIPGAQIVDGYVNSWGEPALAKTMAKAWYDDGVYAIYSAAGSSGNGTIAQAKEYRAAGRKVWAIGVDSDQHEEGLYDAYESAVLTSMLKNVDISLIYCLRAIKNNTFAGEVITFDLVKDGVGYSKSNHEMSIDIIIELEAIKHRIISGDIKIAATNREAKLLPGFPQNLKAVDD